MLLVGLLLPFDDGFVDCHFLPPSGLKTAYSFNTKSRRVSRKKTFSNPLFSDKMTA
jgi:hypothetical protein